MSSQIVRPSIPYYGSIPGGLHDGKLIEINGHIPYGSDAFEINLATGLDRYSDRALHISVRFNGRVVVRNTLEMNEWCTEERDGPFPFHTGRDFSLMILVEQLYYRISVNNQHCFEFCHRIPMSRVSTLFIDGEVNIERIEFIDKMSPYQPGYRPEPVGFPGQIDPGFYHPPPGICPPMVNPSGRVSPGYHRPNYPSYPTSIVTPPEQISPGYIPGGRSDLTPVYNPSIPYAYPIYGGLVPGMMIYISGRPSASAYTFALNLQDGTAPYPPPDVGFHMSVRFFNRTLVRNTRVNDVWEHEETTLPYFPFQQGVNFDMIIRVEQSSFMVALNGQHLFEFVHRLMPLDRFDTLYIENDIIVSSIRFA